MRVNAKRGVAVKQSRRPRWLAEFAEHPSDPVLTHRQPLARNAIRDRVLSMLPKVITIHTGRHGEERPRID